MKKLTTYVTEKFRVSKDMGVRLTPKSFDELRKIIEQRYKEHGPGTKQNPIEFNDIDVSKMTEFCNPLDSYTGIFEDTKFEYIDISYWNVSNIEDMSNMFYSCKYLKSIGDISNWDVSNVKDITTMFSDCKNLKSIGDLSNWDVSNVKNTSWMFAECKQLKSVGDLSNWNVSNVEDMGSMFYNSGITNIPKWYYRK